MSTVIIDRTGSLARAGFEPVQKTPKKSGMSPIGGAESGAVGAREAPEALDDPLLAEILHAWPRLSAATRQRILELVRQEEPA